MPFKIFVKDIDEEEYVEDLNELVNISEELQLDENQFEMVLLSCTVMLVIIDFYNEFFLGFPTNRLQKN